MISFLQELEKKIRGAFNPEKIQLINKSHLHRKHKSFDIDKLHLKLIIYSMKLKSMKKTEAHKMIFLHLKEEMKNKIHALEIEIR